MSILGLFNKYWPIMLGGGTILSLAFSFLYQFYSLKYTVDAGSQQLADERLSMKQYVDYKDKATNIRIDDLETDVSKIHDDLTNLGTRVDNIQSQISNQIEQSRVEQNERLDQIILIMNSKSKR